jgi:hypothetical protein
MLRFLVQAAKQSACAALGLQAETLVATINGIIFSFSLSLFHWLIVNSPRRRCRRVPKFGTDLLQFGGASGGSGVLRPRSDDPHQREWKNNLNKRLIKTLICLVQ